MQLFNSIIKTLRDCLYLFYFYLSLLGVLGVTQPPQTFQEQNP